MNRINLFIAGAKELAPQRLKIKALVSDINHRYNESGKGAFLSVASYETYGNKQDDYNDFIKKADLIIFILDGKIGPHTEEEFVIATKNKIETGRPKSVVFLKAYAEVTTDIAYINGLLKNEDYYINYKNDEDLIRCVKEYIEDFVDKAPLSEENDKTSKKILSNPKTERYSRIKISHVIIIVLAAFLIAICCVMYTKSPSSVLLIAGGGSARNYIDKYNNLELETYPNSYHVHMPSGNAWLLLTEEVISPQATKGYIPICISASEAKDEDFLKITTKNNFLESGSVVAVRLGYDTLAVTIEDDDRITDFLGTKCIREGEVSLSALSKLIAECDSINIFTTSPGSGTKATYEKLLKEKNVNLDSINVYQFSEYSDLPTIYGDLPFMLLGSRCYTMKTLDVTKQGDEYHVLKIYDEKHGERTYSCKPIYVYFMANKIKPEDYVNRNLKYDNDGHERLLVPEETINFLKDLGCDIESKIPDGVIIRKTHKSIIMDLGEL